MKQITLLKEKNKANFQRRGIIATLHGIPFPCIALYTLLTDKSILCVAFLNLIFTTYTGYLLGHFSLSMTNGMRSGFERIKEKIIET
mmetsp:Transcript_5693/g.13600  ORF Transcript_5693/g.13600 Transcript_5693/m.13600 type:complete len:87 (+) Transcript_5693:755-1015(+)